MTYELIFHNGFKVQKGQGSSDENSISWGSKEEMETLKKRLDDAFDNFGRERNVTPVSPAHLIAQMTRATICGQDFLMQNGKWFYTQYGDKHGPFKSIEKAYENFDLPI